MAYPKDPWLSLMNTVLLAEEQSLPILTSWVWRVRHRTHDLPDALRERYHQANQIKLYAVTPSSFLIADNVHVKSKYKSGIESMGTSPIPERFMKMKFVLFWFPPLFKQKFSKLFNYDLWKLDVFSVFLLMPKLWGFQEHKFTLNHVYRMYICHRRRNRGVRGA
jgi:hypothetical protein